MNSGTLNELTSLFENIQQLSDKNQVAVANYVDYLRWQEAKRKNIVQGWSYSFIEAFKEASVQATGNPAGMDVKLASATVRGETQPGLWAHPPLSGKAVIEFYVPVPQPVQNLRLRFAVGIRDGSQIAEDNLVAFGVKMNGVRMWGTQTNQLRWKIVEVPLNIIPGDIVRFEFTTETLGSHEWTWAVWGSPELTGEIN